MLWARKLLLDREQIGRDVFTRFRPWERGELLIEHRVRRTCSWFDFCDSAARLARKSDLMSKRIGRHHETAGRY